MIVVFRIVLFLGFSLDFPIIILTFPGAAPQVLRARSVRAPAQTRASNASPDGLHRCQDAQRFELGE